MLNYLPGTKADHCDFCTETNLAMTCVHCGKGYCVLHSSRICSTFCQDCFSKLNLIVEKYVKVRDEFDPLIRQNIERRNVSLRLQLDGIDWVWYTTAINLLEEDEFFVQFEFHKFMVSLFEHIYTIKTVENRNKAVAKAAKTLRININPAVISLGGGTKTQATKIVDPAEILRKQGIPEALIQQMLAAGGIK